MATRKFTTQFLDTVKTDQPQTEFRDALERGLEIRVTRSRVKTWAFRYRRRSDRRKRIITLGRYPDLSLEDARLEAAQTRIAVAQGSDPAAGVQEFKASPTVRELIVEWQTNHAAYNRAAQVRHDDQSILARHVLPHIGDMKAGDLGRRELAAMLNRVKLAQDGRLGFNTPSKATRRLSTRPNRVFELMRAILRWGLSQGIIASDPSSGMKRPIANETPRERTLSTAEIMAFWHGVARIPTAPGMRLAMRLALITGQRIGEVTGIALRDLTLDSSAPVWIIPSAKAKNGKGHRVPLAPLAVSTIRDALALQSDQLVQTPWLFPAPRANSKGVRDSMTAHAASVALALGRSKLGMDYFRVHDLRRTAATRMAELGINPHTIGMVLNHVSGSKSTITGRVYVQYSFDREKREALEVWGACLETIIRDPQRSTDAVIVADIAESQVEFEEASVATR